MVHSCFRCGFRSHPSRVGSTFSGTLHSHSARGGPRNYVSLRIGNGYNGIIKSGSDMSDSAFNKLFFFSTGSSSPFGFCHLFYPPLLLLTTGAYCFNRAFSGPRIIFSVLPTDRQAPAMPQSAITSDLNQSLDIHGLFTTQVTFDLIVMVNRLIEIGR